jgi:hypothetical protein
MTLRLQLKAFIIAILAMMLSLAQGKEGDLAQLERAFLERCDHAKILRDNSLDKLKDSYSSALTRQVDKHKETGDLDAVLPYSNELKALSANEDTLPPLPPTAAGELRQMRAKYQEARTKIQKNHAQTLIDLTEKMLGALKARETTLTKAGKIDAALQARKLREGLEKDQALADARALLSSTSTSGLGRPALRIRRSGDNLEVLVHFDRSGKVSPSSPVSNVREITEPGKSLGDTAATSLGEFIGAKGYEPDAYVAYHQTFEEKDIKGITFTELDAEPRFEIDGQRGLKVSFKDRATNPHASFGPILPTTSSMGAYRITARYLVPKTNRKLTGFMFVQVIGGPVGGRKIEESGKWTTSTVESEGNNPSGTLLFYLSAEPGSKVADVPLSDFVVLGEIKVEHTRFSAWIVNRYDDQGNPEKATEQPEDQAPFVRSGEIQDLP